MRTHADYDLFRDPKVPLEQRQAAFDRMADLSGRLQHPAGVDDLGRSISIPRPTG